MSGICLARLENLLNGRSKNNGYRIYQSKLPPQRCGARHYLIAWNHGGKGSNYTGLTRQDGVTMNEKEEEFFIAE